MLSPSKISGPRRSQIFDNKYLSSNSLKQTSSGQGLTSHSIIKTSDNQHLVSQMSSNSNFGRGSVTQSPLALSYHHGTSFPQAAHDQTKPEFLGSSNSYLSQTQVQQEIPIPIFKPCHTDCEADSMPATFQVPSLGQNAKVSVHKNQFIRINIPLAIEQFKQQMGAKIIEQIYEDGSKYYGEVKGGLREGQGMFVYQNGGLYVGQWLRG